MSFPECGGSSIGAVLMTESIQHAFGSVHSGGDSLGDDKLPLLLDTILHGSFGEVVHYILSQLSASNRSPPENSEASETLEAVLVKSWQQIPSPAKISTSSANLPSFHMSSAATVTAAAESSLSPEPEDNPARISTPVETGTMSTGVPSVPLRSDASRCPPETHGMGFTRNDLKLHSVSILDASGLPPVKSRKVDDPDGSTLNSVELQANIRCNSDENNLVIDADKSSPTAEVLEADRAKTPQWVLPPVEVDTTSSAGDTPSFCSPSAVFAAGSANDGNEVKSKLPVIPCGCKGVLLSSISRASSRVFCQDCYWQMPAPADSFGK